MTIRAAVIALCHGGGPLPVLGDPGHKELIKSMTERVPRILGLGTSRAPKAMVIITAHWSEREPTISNSETPRLFYDYGGMPPEAYQLKYGAAGSPELASEVYDLLAKAGFDPVMDAKRGTVCNVLMRDWS